MIAGPIRAVLFDFDYTLADSSAGVVAAVSYALDVLGLPAAPCEAICRTIGLSLEDTLVALCGEGAAPLAPEFQRLFRLKADEVMAAATTLYAGVAESLAALRRRGLALGVVSSKYAYRIEAVLQREGLLDAVDTIIGGGDVAALKPAADALQEAMRRLGVTASATVYVGDSVVDAEAARRAGVPFIAVLTGPTRAEEFAAYPHLTLLHDVTGLVAYLESAEIQR